MPLSSWSASRAEQRVPHALDMWCIVSHCPSETDQVLIRLSKQNTHPSLRAYYCGHTASLQSYLQISVCFLFLNVEMQRGWKGKTWHHETETRVDVRTQKQRNALSVLMAFWFTATKNIFFKTSSLLLESVGGGRVNSQAGAQVGNDRPPEGGGLKVQVTESNLVFVRSAGLGQSRTASSESVRRRKGRYTPELFITAWGFEQGRVRHPSSQIQLQSQKKGRDSGRQRNWNIAGFGFLTPEQKEQEDKRKRTWDGRFLESPTSCEGGQRLPDGRGAIKL